MNIVRLTVEVSVEGLSIQEVKDRLEFLFSHHRGAELGIRRALDGHFETDIHDPQVALVLGEVDGMVVVNGLGVV